MKKLRTVTWLLTAAVLCLPLSFSAFADDELDEAMALLLEDEKPAAKTAPKPAAPQTVAKPAAVKSAPAVPVAVKKAPPVPEKSKEMLVFQDPEAILKDIQQAKEQKLESLPKKKRRKDTAQKQDYDFIQNLENAQAILIDSDEETQLTGKWTGKNFVFLGNNQADVSAGRITVLDKVRDVISVKLVPSRIHRLEFEQVPPSGRLRIDYWVKETQSNANPEFIYLKVLVGKKVLKRIQISSKDGWKKQTLDLGVVSFLNQPISVTFEITSSKAPGLFISFAPSL